jgi:hypothetical protein
MYQPSTAGTGPWASSRLAHDAHDEQQAEAGLFSPNPNEAKSTPIDSRKVAGIVAVTIIHPTGIWVFIYLQIY